MGELERKRIVIVREDEQRWSRKRTTVSTPTHAASLHYSPESKGRAARARRPSIVAVLIVMSPKVIVGECRESVQVGRSSRRK